MKNERSLAYVVAWFGRNWLGVWFGTISGLWLYLNVRAGILPSFGDDQYIAAVRRWLSGVDPWATEYPGWFAAPPIALLPVVPFAVLPFGQVLKLVVGVAAGVATVRRLRRPWYWLMFPPLFIAMFSQTSDAWLVLVILTGHGWLAVLGKVYAAVPLAVLGRWRPLLIAAVAIVMTWPVLPWASYIAQFPTIQRHLAEQAADLSAPVYLVPVAVISLVLMGRQRAAWMAVPALWPSTQFYYGTIALPALTPLAAAMMAVPGSWSVVLACVVLAVETGREAASTRNEGILALAKRTAANLRRRAYDTRGAH